MTEIRKAYLVAGEVIHTSAIEAALTMMWRLGNFTFMNVGGALYRAGVSWDNHDRAADRLLQRLRRRGIVKYSKGRWTALQNPMETI